MDKASLLPLLFIKSTYRYVYFRCDYGSILEVNNYERTLLSSLYVQIICRCVYNRNCLVFVTAYFRVLKYSTVIVLRYYAWFLIKCILVRKFSEEIYLCIFRKNPGESEFAIGRKRSKNTCRILRNHIW